MSDAKPEGVTPELIAELRRLHGEATPGPWSYCGANAERDGCKCGLIWSRSADCVVLQAVTAENEDITGGEGVGHPQRLANGQLAAALRNAIPGLLSEVERLRADAESVATTLEAMTVPGADRQEMREVCRAAASRLRSAASGEETDAAKT